MPCRKSDGLQLQIELVRPEPWHRIVLRRLARDRPSRRDRLIIGVLNRFKSNDRTARVLIEMGCTIARRVNPRQPRSTLFINQHAVCDLGTGFLQWRDCWRDANANDHRLHKGDTLSELAQDSSRLKSDIASADNDNMLGRR
jgi:hypothetical protein